MNPQSIGLLCVIAVCALLALAHCFKKKRTCGGDCSRCGKNCK